MALFWRLVLAHVAADFALQTDAVFRIKKRFSWGVLLHGSIFALTSILAAIPYLSNLPMWGGLIFLWLFHVAVDKAKLALSTSERRDHLGYFLLDQLFHLGAIGLICLLLDQDPGIAHQARESAALISRLKLGVAYIIAVWVSPLLSFYVRSACLRWKRPRFSGAESGAPRSAADQPLQPSGLWRWMGYLERGCLVAVIAQGGRLLFLIPLILLPRAGLWIFQGKKAPALWELLLGSAVSLAMGLWASTL
jgi:hypothetical protein